MLNRVVMRRQDRERGATAVEYGLMVLLIALVIFVAVATLGTTLSTLFSSVAAAI
jgi:pilus assembly protein Flp/PilA